MSGVIPNYQHDCDACLLVGKDEKRDFYYCSRCELDMGGTVICRFSSDGPDYASSPVFLVQQTLKAGWTILGGEHVPGDDPRVKDQWPLAIALKMADEMGLILRKK